MLTDVQLYVRVTDDEYCVETNAGDSTCGAGRDLARVALEELRPLMPNATVLIVPETTDSVRLDVAREAARAAGFAASRTCEAYTDIWERRDGSFDYPRDPSGSDHVCPQDAELFEPERDRGDNIQRWCRFENGQRQGLYVSFSAETRLPLAVGSYAQNEKHGLWLYFDAHGTVSREQYYAYGRPVDHFP